MKTNKIQIFFVGCLGFFLLSCASSPDMIVVPDYDTTYDSMWSTARKTGRSMGYRLVKEDRSKGKLNFEKPSTDASDGVIDNAYYIRVAFRNLSDAGGDSGFSVSCSSRSAIVSVDLAADCTTIRTAIKRAAGIP